MLITALLLVNLLLLVGGALLLWHGYQQKRDYWQQREKNLLRLMREQESAHEALETAHRTLEQRARQLARSNAELERFAHVASHDLKEPVRTVVSYTQLLAKKYSGQLDADAQEYIRDAAEAARSIRSRIESLLDFARVGDLDEEPARADCRVAVEKAIANLRPAIAQSGAQIHCEALPTVLAHLPELVLLFQNLLDNAIKFRGTRAPEIKIHAERGETREQWRFSITDNGIGIEARSVEKAFALFQRLNPQEPAPGMGMGLPLCRKIVESYGGSIWHEPLEGGGSRFLFTLPAPASS